MIEGQWIGADGTATSRRRRDVEEPSAEVYEAFDHVMNTRRAYEMLGEAVRMLARRARRFKRHPIEELNLPLAHAVTRATWKGWRTMAARALDCAREDYVKCFPEEEDLLTIMPPRPASMPTSLSSFFSTIHSRDPDGTAAMLALASAPREPGEAAAVLLDLTLLRAGDPLGGSFRAGAWRAIVDELHARQREIFEASITDGARSLFQ